MTEKEQPENHKEVTAELDRTRPVRWLLVTAGSISLGLGILGIITPLLPTTPFLLLAAACYYRGSDRLHNWLLNHTVFGKYITDYLEKRAIPGRMKIKTVSLLWITIGISAVFFTDSLWIRLLLLIIAVIVSVHLVRLKTLKG